MSRASRYSFTRVKKRKFPNFAKRLKASITRRWKDARHPVSHSLRSPPHPSPSHRRAYFRRYCHRLTCSFSLDSTFHRRKGGGPRLKFQPNTLLTADSAVKKRARAPSLAGLQREIKTARAIGPRTRLLSRLIFLISLLLSFSLSLSFFPSFSFFFVSDLL